MPIFPAPTGAGGVNDAATTVAQQQLNFQNSAQALRDIFGTADTTTAIQTVIDQGSDRPVTVAAAATTSLATGNVVTISNATGATAITSLGTAAAGARRNAYFTIAAGSITLTHNATSLQLPGGANITCQTGDRARFESLGGGNWRCVDYIPAYYRPDGSAGAVVTLTTTATLTAATHANATLLVTGAAAYVVTLPSAATMPAGSKIKFQGYQSGGVGASITRAGTDTINAGLGTTTTVANVYGGDTLELTCNGVSAWYVTQGKLRYETAWTATLPAAGAAVTVAHGLGSAPRMYTMIAQCTTAELGYAIGDNATPIGVNAAFGVPAPVWASAANIGVTGVLGNASAPWNFVNKTTGAVSIATSASWKYKLIAEL